jgi:hypothetical protein
MIMKHRACFGAALIISFLLQSGFRSQTNLFGKLTGTWKADKIIYSLSSEDSTAVSPVAEFIFNGGANPSDQHEGHYQFSGKVRYAFLYQLESNELIIAVLSPSGQPLNRLAFFGSQPDLSAVWTVSELPGGLMKLNGQATIRRGSKDESVNVEISLKR